MREAMTLHNPGQCVYVDCEEQHTSQPDEHECVVAVELQEVSWEKPCSLKQRR